jgi:3-deoxy-7-phosphoheptulonate synthase
VLPPLVEAVERARGPRSVVWECDPMHGNTTETANGYKTRHFDDVMDEVRASSRCTRASARGRAACTSSCPATPSRVPRGRQQLTDATSRPLRDACDPRLNTSQALELAFLVAEMLQARRDR